MIHPSITIQGNIISGEILEKIHNEELAHQTPAAFGLPRNARVRDEIGLAWSTIRSLWQTFRIRKERLTPDESGTSETRNFWMLPFLTTLGYDVEKANAEVLDDKTYAISHRATNLQGFPVHIMGINDSLDKRRETSGPRLSPHALVQEYLNKAEDHLYALVTNGRHLRLLRDATRLVRLTYLEFDLEKMMEEELFSDFALLYRVLHTSRMPKEKGEGETAVIEQYHQDSLEAGTRIRDDLREAVKKSIEGLANGFLQHPLNEELRNKIASNEIKPIDLYQQLLRLIYRFLFLLVTEDRNLIYPDKGSDELKRLRKNYFSFYSIDRIRRLAMRRLFVDAGKHDIWESVKVTFSLFEYGKFGEKLGIKPLGSGVFEPGTINLLTSQYINNGIFLEVIKHLCYLELPDYRGLARVNYGDLDVEEFGSVYESLLDLHPVIRQMESRAPFFGFSQGSERKTTGSYYTRHDLVSQLLKSSLEPLMEERLKGLATRAEQEKALLSLKVCDPACGSGHFLLAAARKIALRLAQVRTGEDNPGKEPMMQALRQVIQYCIYGVDKNPSAVELCKVALWIEGHNTGKPLSFLDHKIRPGDSLVGVDILERLKEGIPDDAFAPVTHDDKKAAQAQKKRNAAFRKQKQFNLFFGRVDFDSDTRRFAQGMQAVEALQGDDLDQVQEQKKRYEAFRANQGWWKDFTACNLFTYAFYQEYPEGKPDHLYVNSEYLARYLQSAGSLNAQLEAKASAQAMKTNFFHWPLEFPDVTEQGGFDLILANPPWEIVELKEKEFFETRDPKIAQASNKAERSILIEKLLHTKPELYKEYIVELREINCSRKYMQNSGALFLTNSGRLNLYAAFAEKILHSINTRGNAGFIVPTGIATDDGNKRYFAHLVEKGQLVSLFDFENRKAIFPTVHRSYKFSLITLGGPKPNRQTRFGFFLHDVLDLTDKRRVFALTQQDFININPNTKTTPIFRTRQDAELTAKIYSRVPVLINEEKNQNPWGVSFKQGLFNMSSDSHLFRTRAQMEQTGFALMGNRFVKGSEIYLPLYESKMIWHFDHRFGTYTGVDSRTSTQTPTPSQEQYKDPFYQILPWYWVTKDEVEKQTERKWFLGFRDIARNTDVRTAIFTILPQAGVGNNMPLFFQSRSSTFRFLLFTNLKSLVLDYFVRQKTAGTHLNFFYVEQFALLHFKTYNEGLKSTLLPVVMEMIYTSWDIKAFADDLWREADDELKAAIRGQWEENKKATGGHPWQVPEWAPAYPEIDWEPEKNGGCPLPPFKWDEERRALLRAELDAWYALLYGLERDELRYILDPQDVHGPDFPGETFRVLKEKENRKYGEYRTRRLVLEAYDHLRPTWDMDAHLRKLKDIWEECQDDLSEKARPYKKASGKSSKANEPQGGYGTLFDQLNE